jgi:hypothetical protein
MREQLIQAKINFQMQIDRIDQALKFFDEHPEMEMMLTAYMAITQAPMMARF